MKLRILLAFALALGSAYAQQGEWKTYANDDSATRFSPLKQINASNVNRLTVNWVMQTGVPGKYETTSLFENGILYSTGPSGHAWAIDARTGRALWHFDRALPTRGLGVCCGPLNRGFALAGDRLFMSTVDAHLLALDKKTGTMLWDSTTADYKQGYSATAAPLIVKDKVIVGMAGAEFAIRGFVDAYSIETGERIWRFWTVPGPGEPGAETWQDTTEAWKRGGGSTWGTGSFDPKLNLVYWGIGNPGPDLNAKVRPGDNLYTNSIVALDPDTGKIKWHFQNTPSDTHDWDGISEPILADVKMNGQDRKIVLQANRNGFFYALDRTNGKFIYGFPFVHQTWAQGLDANGRPIKVPGLDPTKEGQEVCPSLGGGKNWNHAAYNPETGMMYVPASEGCEIFYISEIEVPEPPRMWMGSIHERATDYPQTGSMQAIDAATGKKVWEFKTIAGMRGSVLTTGGDLVFYGDGFGYLMAFHARTGKVLWKMNTGAGIGRVGGISAPPMTYLLDGKQHINVFAGGAMFDFTLMEGQQGGSANRINNFSGEDLRPSLERDCYQVVG